MKYLVISAVLGLAFALVYSRVRPYINLVRKIAHTINSAGTPVAGPSTSGTKAAVENKLIRCAGCNTWIPVDRAVNSRAGLSAYCSTECLEKASLEKKHKLAG